MRRAQGTGSERLDETDLAPHLQTVHCMTQGKPRSAAGFALPTPSAQPPELGCRPCGLGCIPVWGASRLLKVDKRIRCSEVRKPAWPRQHTWQLHLDMTSGSTGAALLMHGSWEGRGEAVHVSLYKRAK